MATSANQAARKLRTAPVVCARYRVHRIAARLTCSDGAWLNGRSKLVRALMRWPAHPLTAGRSKVQRSGNTRKHAMDKSWIATRRFPCRSSSSRVPQIASDNAYSRSEDQYGRIVHGRKGMRRSQANIRTGTFGWRLAAALAKLYVTK